MSETDTTALVFMDTETLGLDKAAPIWEFAAVRRNEDGSEEVYHHFIAHDPYKHVLSGRKWNADAPQWFQDDYNNRYNPHEAIHTRDLVGLLDHIYRGRAHTVGAVPNFDTERLGRLCDRYKAKEPWHYHLIDIETRAEGFLAGRGKPVPRPWSSDDLSRRLGVDPEKFERHSALGDVYWEMAQWDAMENWPGDPEFQGGLLDIWSDVKWDVRALRTGRLGLSDVPGLLRDLVQGYWA